MNLIEKIKISIQQFLKRDFSETEKKWIEKFEMISIVLSVILLMIIFILISI